jgi:hydroxymethylpyrimidine/phosphomethylpyrimidine kinase
MGRDENLPPKGRVLIVAGSDSGGGAGIQGDIKTVSALGGYAATAISALTAQNTQGVSGIFDVPADFVVRQMEAVISDIGVDCVKLGMLHRAEVIIGVADALESLCPATPIVLDPVMVAKGGHLLLEKEAVDVLVARLLPQSFLLTPNIFEAESLSGLSIKNAKDAEVAAERILEMGGVEAVLVKGGHLPGDALSDVLVRKDGEKRIYRSQRIKTRHTHGTGCALSSAIATGLAWGMDLEKAVVRARDFVAKAISANPGLGLGAGPLGFNQAARFSGEEGS